MFASGFFKLAFAFSILFPATSARTDPQHVWSKRFSFPDLNNQSANQAIAVDASGNVFISGLSVEVNPIEPAFAVAGNFLTKFGPNGETMWSKRLGWGIGRPQIALDASGNVFLAGGLLSPIDFGAGLLDPELMADVLVVKFNNDGVHQWSRIFGPGTASALALSIDATGNPVIAGEASGTVDFGEGPSPAKSIFIAGFDVDGSHLWSRSMTPSSDDFWSSHAMEVTPSGAVAVTGRFRGNLDFGGGLLDFHPGVFGSESDIFVACYDDEGDHVWSRGFGNSDNDVGFDVARDGPGNIVVVGQHEGPVSFGGPPLLTPQYAAAPFVAKFSAAGTHLWSIGGGDQATGAAIGVGIDGQGDAFITGHHRGAADFGGGDLVSDATDIFVARFSSDGTHEWSDRFGDSAPQVGGSIGFDDNHFYLSGYYGGTLNVGGDDLAGPPEFNMFIAKFASEPVSVAITSFEALVGLNFVELRAAFRSNLGAEVVNIYRDEGVGLRNIESVGSHGEEFHYLDRDVAPGNTYRYQIGVVDADGEFLSPIVTAHVPQLAAALSQNKPNPFNPSTIIPFAVPKQEHVNLSIYDARGRRVRTLIDELREAGSYGVEWDGHDDEGRVVSSGVYFYRIQLGKFSDSRKMILLK